MTNRRRCSCQTGTCAEAAPSAVPRTSTATAARSAAPPTRRPIWSILSLRSAANGRCGVNPTICSSRWASSTPCCVSGSTAEHCNLECGPSSRSGSTPGCRIGTSRATPPISDSRFPTLRGSSSTSGSTRRLATSAVCERFANGADSTPRSTSRRTVAPSFIISSARTSATSTRCSGPLCCRARVSANPPPFSSMAS